MWVCTLPDRCVLVQSFEQASIKAYQASRRGIVLTANYTATQKGVKKCLSGSGCCSAQNGALSTVFFHAAGDLWRVYRSGGALWM